MTETCCRELERLATEAHRPELADIDLAATEEVVVAMNRENAHAVAVVLAAAPAIAAAIDAIVARMSRGGRLIYAGAGTAGRIGVLDASEIPPTFATDPAQVVALIAGGPAAIVTAVEGAEDELDGAVPQLEALGVGPLDSVVAISASGRTRYAIGALRCARQAGALTVALAGNHASELAAVADHAIEVEVGRSSWSVRPAEGRHRTETGVEHDQHGGHDAAGQDLREPDGPPARHQRQAARPRQAHRGAGDRVRPGAGRRGAGRGGR